MLRNENRLGRFGEALAQFSRDALLNDVAEEAGERRRNGDEDPQKRRHDKASDGYSFKRDGDDVSLIEMKLQPGDVGDQLNAAYDNGGQ